jgi:hypothetical protein
LNDEPGGVPALLAWARQSPEAGEAEVRARLSAVVAEYRPTTGAGRRSDAASLVG